jgi:hypothetical protein
MVVMNRNLLTFFSEQCNIPSGLALQFTISCRARILPAIRNSQKREGRLQIHCWKNRNFASTIPDFLNSEYISIAQQNGTRCAFRPK